MTKITKFTSLIATLVAIAVLFAGGPVFADEGGTPQASITLINCNNALCNANDTAWTLDKTPASQSLTGNNTITWAVTATKGATTDNFITINGFITVKNTGTADATIGNIVVNLQKPRTGPNTGACRNVPWVSAAADVANAGPIPPSWTFCANEGGFCSFSGTQNVRYGSDMFTTYFYGTFTNGTPCNNDVFGDPIFGVFKTCAYGTDGDGATLANIVAAASTEVPGCNAAQGAVNYTVSGPGGTFVETPGVSGKLEFTLTDSTAFSLTPEYKLKPGDSIDLLYSATFDNTVLGLADGSRVRVEVIVTFGNAGGHGGSGSIATNIDIDGDNIINCNNNNIGDECQVRSVPCRVTSAIPALVNGNSTVTLTDTSSDVTVTPAEGGVAVSNFLTDIGGGTGSEDISVTTVRSVSVYETCTTPGAATVNNTANLNGASSFITVQGNQSGVDPATGLPIYQNYDFTCVQGVDLDAAANAGVSCGNVGSWTFCANEGGFCSFSGTQNVRYGSDMFTTYFYGTFTNGTPCNNDVFGDPIYGAFKTCAYGGPIPPW